MSADNKIISTQHSIYSHWYWAVAALALLAIIYSLARLILQILAQRRLLQQKFVFFELLPPANRDKTPLATEQLFSVLHGLDVTRSLLDKLLLRKVVLSLEVVSSRSEGIRYIARISEREADIFRQNINSYMSDVRMRKVKDYLPDEILYKNNRRILPFRQTGHFAYPLEIHETLPQHDPIAYITGAMTKLEPDELIAFQLVASPASVRQAARLEKTILANQNVRAKLKRGQTASLFIRIVKLIIMLPIRFLQGVIYELFYSYDRSSKSSVVPRPLSPAEQELTDSIHRKLVQPLFQVDVRALVVAGSKHRVVERTQALRSSLASYTKPGYQSIKTHKSIFSSEKRRESMFRNRLPSLMDGSSSIFSAFELASIYHFPNSLSAKTENVIKSLSRTLPAPVSLKNGTKLDILLGANHHHGSTTPIGLTTAERDRHVYIIGGTGNGKTTMLLYGIVQDIKNGKGLAVVDPHGDLAETILKHVPADRINDVIYLNPTDIAYPIGLNLLEIPAGLSEDETLVEKDLVTESVISVFRKIFSDDDTGGHRIEYILRNTIHTAFTVPDATIFTVFKLLTDEDFRKQVRNKLEDGDLKNFWKNELGKAGEFQRVKMSAGITAKIGRFRFNESAKRIMEQPRSTIDFDDILNSGKILICNFSKGNLGEDTSALFGVAMLAKLQLAALRRARTEQTKRRPFYVYVDEFQNFATMSFVQLLSEARKYKLFLTMAEQSTSQQEEWRMVNIILANVGTVICFRSGSPTDEEFILPLFSPYIEQGEIANLPAYNFYMRIAAVQAQEPLSGETVLLADSGSKQAAKQVIGASRQHYAIKYVAPKKEPAKPSAETNKQADSGTVTMTKPVRHRKGRKQKALVPQK